MLRLQIDVLSFPRAMIDLCANIDLGGPGVGVLAPALPPYLQSIGAVPVPGLRTGPEHHIST